MQSATLKNPRLAVLKTAIKGYKPDLTLVLNSLNTTVPDIDIESLPYSDQLAIRFSPSDIGSAATRVRVVRYGKRISIR